MLSIHGKTVNLNIRIRFKPKKLSVKVDMHNVMKLACMWTSLEDSYIASYQYIAAAYLLHL